MNLSTEELGIIRGWFERLLNMGREHLTDKDYEVGRLMINEHGAQILKDREKKKES